MNIRRNAIEVAGRLALALALTTSLVPAATIPAFAAAVERLDPATAPATYPGAEPGALRTWVQLVWNPTARQLERLSFTAWDPIPSLGLELQWQPDDPAALGTGPITGRGTLSFRQPGAAAYDPAATRAQYRGELKAGRADGSGEFLDQSGFAYAGEWRAGLMDGAGRLTLPNGDQYVGAFRAGQRDGEGVYTDATGEVSDGRFANGLPADVRIIPSATDYPAVDDLRIGLVAERRPHNYALGIDPLSYTSKSDGQVLDILPNDQRLLDVWHGATSITMTDDEMAAFNNGDATPSFLGAYERFEPLSLVFELENSSTEPVSVVGGFLDVANSVRDKEPAIQVRPYPRDPCGGEIEFLPRFFIDNFGWASADNAALNLTIGSLDGRSEGTPLAVDLGSIDSSIKADIGDQLQKLGLDTAYVATTRLQCTDPNDQRQCLAELRQSGHFGQLGDFLSLDYTTVSVAAIGTLDYDWIGTDGTVNHKSSPFSVTIPIASVANDAECGEGGEIVPVRHDPFQLHLDEQNYKIAIPFAGDVTPGFTTRWRIDLTAPETSEHDMQLVLVLADGRQIASRPVHLTYFIPPERELAN